MLTFVTVAASLLAENHSAPALLSNDAATDIVVAAGNASTLDEYASMAKILVVVEELPNGVQKVSLFESSFDLEYLEGEWYCLKMENQHCNDPQCLEDHESEPLSYNVRKLFDEMEFDLAQDDPIYVGFFDKPGYFPSSEVPSKLERGSLVPPNINGDEA